MNKQSHIGIAALNNETTLKRIVLGGLCVLAVSSSLYVFFVGKIVFDVIGRRQAEKEIKLTQSSLGELQVAYLSELQGIGLDKASSIGLSESSHTLYAVRVSTTPKTVGMLDTR